MEIFDSMGTTCYQWPAERVYLENVAATTNSDSVTLLATQIAALSSKINALSIAKMESAVKSPMMMEEANFVSNWNFRNFQHGGFQRVQQGNNQSWQQLYHGGCPNNSFLAPPGFSVTNGVINEEKKPNLEELLMKFISKLDERMEKLESTTAALGTRMKVFETQMTQVTTAISNLYQSGQFSSNTVVSPKEQCMTIELESDTSYEEPQAMEEEQEVLKVEMSLKDENFKSVEERNVLNVVDTCIDQGKSLKACLFSFYLTPFFDFNFDSSDEHFLECGSTSDCSQDGHSFQEILKVGKPPYHWFATDDVLKFDEKWPPPIPTGSLS